MYLADTSNALFKMSMGNPGIRITPGAQALLSPAQFFEITGAHYRVEQCQLDDEDYAANQHALIDGSRIFTSHNLGTKTKPEPIWIITEASTTDGKPRDRTNCPTTILTPSEY